MKRYDVGFLGGGQLARMSIQAAQRMGLSCVSLDPGAVTPASQIADAIQGALDDPQKIAEILRSSERTTLENEFIPAGAIREACKIAGVPESHVVPGIDTLAAIQDKLLQKKTLMDYGVLCPHAVELTGDGMDAVAEIGFPMVLKARFGGYDGKGTRYARNLGELRALEPLWSPGGWMAEQYVPFIRELAAMVYVGPSGSGAFPTMETIQTNHVCDLVFPARANASDVALASVRAVGGQGLFGVEMFEMDGGEVLVNEMAPRPHNSGHYTLDWGAVSQFEQHIRVVTGLTPGQTNGVSVCMANLLGQENAKDFRNGTRAALLDPTIHVHWYGKVDSRPGRKMGHLNAVRGSDLVERAIAARERFYRAWVAD